MADMSLWGQKRYPDRFAPFLTPLEIPSSGVFDPPYICVPINIHWAAIVRGALSAAQRDEIWQGDENQRFDAIQQILELTAAMVNQRPECEAACMIRVSPTDNCQIQQSLNGGETWDDVFRLDSCFVTPLVSVEAVEGGNLVRFDMNADTFPEEEVFIPDGVNGQNAAVPIVSVNPVEGGTNVAFDMNADTFPEETVFIPDGAQGAQGAAAPTPIVSVNPVEGGTNVAFDMNADTFPEETVFIPDGVNGQNAAVPIVSVNPVEGGTNVAFDMNADTFPEETVFIPDGAQGAQGAAAPTPIVSVNPVEGGTNVAFDMNADTFPEETVFIPDGGVIYPAPPEIVGNPNCRVASYLTDLVLPSLLAEAAQEREGSGNLLTFAGALAGITAAGTGGVSLGVTAGLAGLAGQWFSYTSAQITNAATPLFWEEIREKLYCELQSPSEIEAQTPGLINGYFAAHFAENPAIIDPTDSPAHDVVRGLILNLSDNAYASITQIAAYYEDGGSCDLFCGGGGFEGEWIRDYDFTIDEQTWVFGGGTDALYDAGVGWRQNLSSDKVIEINKTEPLYITGMVVYMTRVLDGNLNNFEFRNSNNGALMLQLQNNTDTIVELPVDLDFPNILNFTIHESTLGTSVDNLWITRITLYGNGTPATGGVAL